MSILRPITIPKEWTDGFARALDDHLRDILAVVNGGVRLTDQIPTVKTGIRWNSSASPVKVGPFSRTVRWLVVLAARETLAPSVITSHPTVRWRQDAGNVELTEIDGLTAGVDYTLDVWFLEG